LGFDWLLLCRICGNEIKEQAFQEHLTIVHKVCKDDAFMVMKLIQELNIMDRYRHEIDRILNNMGSHLKYSKEILMDV
jgi:hypothetical protein